MFARFGRLPPTIRGIAWATVSSATYALTYATIRELSGTFSVFQITFFRASIGVLFMLPWLIKVGVGVLRTDRALLYGGRSIVTYTGMVCWFYGLAHVGLADATALMFTAPFFTLIILSFAIGERVGPQRWAAVAIGFIGALIIIRPGFAEVGYATAALIYVAVSYGASNAATRALAITEPTNAVVFYMFALVLPLSLVPAILTWAMPKPSEIPMILAFGLLSWVSMQCMTRALAAAAAAVITPMYYLQLPFVGVVAYLLYDEVPGWHICVGALIIIGSSYFVVRNEARAARRGVVVTPPAGE